MATESRSLSDLKLSLRTLNLDDYEDVKEIMSHVYPYMGPWTYQQFKAQVTKFPEGQICIEDNGKVVASAISVIVDYAKYGIALGSNGAEKAEPLEVFPNPT
ncbi:MAG: hypothetical protein BRD49_02885, partial [Bacteroidetes bacterium SW_10_40_5]